MIKRNNSTDLEVKERNVVSDDFRQGSNNTHDDQQLGVGRTPHDKQRRPARVENRRSYYTTITLLLLLFYVL
jgi:hypothetical protein